MKKVAVLILFFVLAAGHSYAQREVIDSILRVVNALPDTAKTGAYFNLGRNYINISLDSATLYLFKGLALAKQYNNKSIEARSYSLLGVAEKNKGNYDQAITYHLTSLKLNEEQKDERSMAVSYNDLGVLYRSMGRYDEALNYYKKSNELCRKVNFTKGISMTYNNIGTILRAKEMPDSALHYYQLGLKTAEELGDTYSISTCLSNIGEIYNESNRYTAALDIFKKCLIYDKENEDKDGMVNSYTAIGLTLTHLKQYRQAIAYIDSAYRICKDEELTTNVLDVLNIKAQTYKEMGDIKAALKTEDEYIAIKDTVMNKEISQHIAEYQTKYETEKKEKQIVTLKQQKEIAALMITKQELLLQKARYRMLAIVGIVMLAAIVAYLLYNRQQVKQKQAREKAVMSAEFNERQRIAKDVHDDLGSGLSKISLMADLAQKRATDSVKLGNEIQEISNVSKDLADRLNRIVWDNKPGETILDDSSNKLKAIGEGLAQISMTAQMARQDMVNSAAMGHDIRQIASVSKELIDNMRDLIWVLNPDNTTLDNLVARLREYCADYLDGMQIEAVLDFPRDVPMMRISREAQRNIFSTVKESINNCVKHSGATEVLITLGLNNNLFAISVKDNGKGFNMTELKGSGNGLRNMKQRIETIGGTFGIHSSAGTEIVISVPFDKLALQVKNTTIV